MFLFNLSQQGERKEQREGRRGEQRSERQTEGHWEGRGRKEREGRGGKNERKKAGKKIKGMEGPGRVVQVGIKETSRPLVSEAFVDQFRFHSKWERSHQIDSEQKSDMIRLLFFFLNHSILHQGRILSIKNKIHI